MKNSKTTSQVETVEIIPEIDTKVDGSWQPIEGETVRALKDQIMRSRTESRIQEGEWETIKTEAISVLSKCVPPTAPPRQETGLVIGYVQSGKTLSFTTVAALARDNGYQMVIVIAGVSLNLLDQSTQRLEGDLDLLGQSRRKWQHFKSSEFNEGDHKEIADGLEDWRESRDSKVPQQECQTVLITVMKNYQHLKDLDCLLSKLNLSDVPTLVIDDEGDQASLNTQVKKGETSTTYQRILSLRRHLPHHTFLQYTATPQAPLLINLIDILSPKFAKVLTPGLKYTGGKAFFQDAPNQIRTIPDNEIPRKNNPLDAPPESLLEAMRIFLLGVSIGMMDNSDDNRSMMVHPSYQTIGHKRYLHWVEKIMENWVDILKLGEGETDRQDLLEEFRNSYEDLQNTVPDLPSFEEISTRLLRAIRKTRPFEVNATHRKTQSVPWRRVYAPILIGGAALDRGYTVEGLTVTYMPRGAGVGNADTIQQRARFFGYKEDVFGFCRVFLEDRVRNAYRYYIIHEKDVRQRLIEHDKTSKSLDEWRRTFFLDVSLKPTRHNILDIDYRQGNLSSQWYIPKAPHYSIEAIEANRSTVQKFCKNLQFRDDEGNCQRTEVQIHDVAVVSLKDVYRELLVPFRTTLSVDSQKFTGIRLQIASYVENHPQTLCTIYRMSKGNLRKRTLGKKNEISQPILFQGPNPKTGKIYPGDSKIRGRGVTIQIHKLELTTENGDIFSDVPVVTVWLPKNVSTGWLVQDQGGTEIES